MVVPSGDSALPLSLGVMGMVSAFIFLASAAWDWQVKSAPSPPNVPAGGLWLLRVGWLLLTVALAADGLARNTFPVDSSAGMLMSIGWGLAGLAIYLDLAFQHRLPVWVISSATMACLFAASRLGGETHAFTSSVKPLILLHIAAAILAYCHIAAQALNALVYLLQDRALAQRKFGGIYGLLPALVPLNKIGINLMGAAVWMLGVSLIIGAVDAFTGNAGWVNLPKLVMAAATLLFAAILLVLRRRSTLSGAAFARGSLWLLLPALLALWLSLPTAR